MRVFKWGKSLAVRLPDAVVTTLRLRASDDIELVVTGIRELQVERNKSRDLALARLRSLKRPLPEGFRFDREIGNAR
jgi:antitoxin MazE